jgi:hypothetical protein
MDKEQLKQEFIKFYGDFINMKSEFVWNYIEDNCLSQQSDPSKESWDDIEESYHQFINFIDNGYVSFAYYLTKYYHPPINKSDPSIGYKVKENIIKPSCDYESLRIEFNKLIDEAILKDNLK